jgi:hypothetical protein
MAVSPDDPWLLPFLRTMSLRPAAYLYAQTVLVLDVYIHAYKRARVDLGVPGYGRGEENLLSDFSEWLEAKLGLHDTRGWVWLIERTDPSPTNVQTFIRLFDAFLKESAGLPKGLSR